MTSFRLSQSLQMTILSLMKIVKSSPKVWKMVWEKVKLLVTSNFFFSHGVFKRLVLQTRKNQGLFGKGLKILCNKEKIMVSSIVLTHSHTMTPFDAHGKQAF